MIRMECPFCDVAVEGQDFDAVLPIIWEHGQEAHIRPELAEGD